MRLEPGPDAAGGFRLPSGRRRRVALVLDPRFPGGTSSAVAAEIRALAPAVDLRVVGIETAMFRGREVNTALSDALEGEGLDLVWAPPVVRADTIVFHNPSALKFDTALPVRFSCASAVLVTHENFLRPGGGEGFDVAHCLSLLESRLVASSRWLAPVSATNRRSVEEWLRQTDASWALTPFDWFNICDMPVRPPTRAPRDRRGRHSRPGAEKFPPTEWMLRHFPAHAERVVILGGDGFLSEPDDVPAHWDLRRFGETEVARFLEEIDFFVYFTHPLWRESFGRVIAEAIAAGKVVLTDPATAENFGPAVVATGPEEVDATIARFLAAPAEYAAFAARAQDWLARFRPEAFRAAVGGGLSQLEARSDVLL
ncbi:hypothetical protein [uncultured Jannaschia sp.]|uniref:hypothetical protein n=1 Tax=uncultured Jannaschia sp. TaxID=293347 RepID=UPI00261CB3CF|nr:hypothetical protein [uncultured Jannaschia sp.]